MNICAWSPLKLKRVVFIRDNFSLHNHMHSSTATEKLSWLNRTLFSFSCPVLDLFPVGDNPCGGEHTFNRNRWRAHAEMDVSNFAQGWQWLFVSLPEGEWLVIELRRNAHVKIMFYLDLRRVCLGRVHLLSASFEVACTLKLVPLCRSCLHQLHWNLFAKSTLKNSENY